MVSGLLTLLVFLLALGGMIFVHEFGHFLAARWAKIEVEEFGFGFPPRAFGFWRSKGFLIFNRQRIEIPENFERSFDWQRVLDQSVKVTVDQVGINIFCVHLNLSWKVITQDRPCLTRIKSLLMPTVNSSRHPNNLCLAEKRLD